MKTRMATTARKMVPREETTLLSNFTEAHEAGSLDASAMMLFKEGSENWKGK